MTLFDKPRVSFQTDPYNYGASAAEQQNAAYGAYDDAHADKGAWNIGGAMAGTGAYLAGLKGMGAISAAASKSRNPLVRTMGSVAGFASRGVTGQASRWMANKGLTKNIGNITSVADYRNSLKPGLWAKALRTPIHLMPDMTVPYAGAARQMGGAALGMFGMHKLDSLTADEQGRTWGDRFLPDSEATTAALYGLPSSLASAGFAAGDRLQTNSNLANRFQDYYNTRLAQEVDAGNKSRTDSALPMSIIMALLFGLGSKATLGSFAPGALAGLGLGAGYGAAGRRIGPSQSWNGGFGAEGMPNAAALTSRDPSTTDANWAASRSNLDIPGLDAIRAAATSMRQ